MAVNVVHLDTRRPIGCPHCDAVMAVAALDGHLRFDCPALTSKRRHPAGRGIDPEGVA